MPKVLALPRPAPAARRPPRAVERIVFTQRRASNLLHPGPRPLSCTPPSGSVTCWSVGLNSRAARVRRLAKGPERPLVRERDRAPSVLAALEMVDYVTIFGADTPYELIKGDATPTCW
jgi:bifunctional ADP-heptose synthase (sugar kinase/adenylyltransferase)